MFGIISVPPIGSFPYQRIYNATRECLEELNDDARAIHAMLDSLLCKFSSEFEGMEYSRGNAYEMTYNFIEITHFHSVNNSLVEKYNMHLYM